METKLVIMQEEAFNQIMKKLESIEQMLNERQKQPKEIFLDNTEFHKVMNISKRTAQAWRDEGIISFSQIGGKIFYRMSDIQALLDKNHRKAFKR